MTCVGLRPELGPEVFVKSRRGVRDIRDEHSLLEAEEKSVFAQCTPALVLWWSSQLRAAFNLPGNEAESDVQKTVGRSVQMTNRPTSSNGRD